jgi:hypothetical protein
MNELYTVANLQVQWQVPHHLMRQALGAIGATPDLTLNGVPYFSCDESRTELLRAFFETRRANSERNRGEWTPGPLPIPENYRPVNHFQKGTDQ